MSDYTAQALASAERHLADATAAHQAAQAKLDNITVLLTAVTDRMLAVSQARINGTSNAAETAEYQALFGDEALLTRMLTDATRETESAFTQVQTTREILRQRQADHQRQLDQATYQALLAKAQEIEAVFVQAIGAVGKAGKQIGHFTLGQSYPKSEAMRRAFDLNVIPE